MTTIIITALGILLAVIAATSVLFFGGTSFTQGSIGARADSMQNVGANVVSADRLYAAQGEGSATSLSELRNGDYLKIFAVPAADGAAQDAWGSLPTTAGATATVFEVTGVPADLCARINKNLRGSSDIPTTVSGPYGCVSSGQDRVYYALVSGEGDAGSSSATKTGEARPAYMPGQWVDCGGENQYCDFVGTTTVRYGVPGRYITMQATNGQACNYGAFGGDPAPGIGKACQYDASTAYTPQWVTCAAEGGQCSFDGSALVRIGLPTSYGYQGSFVTKQESNGVQCGPATFGSYPYQGQGAVCQYDGATARQIAWQNCAGESGNCVLSGTGRLRYGANGRYYYATGTDIVRCTTTTFGGDPDVGIGKSCDYDPTQLKPATWATCGQEGGTCTAPGARLYRYGVGSRWYYFPLHGTASCDYRVLGDPAPGDSKHCEAITN